MRALIPVAAGVWMSAMACGGRDADEPHPAPAPVPTADAVESMFVPMSVQAGDWVLELSIDATWGPITSEPGGLRARGFAACPGTCLAVTVRPVPTEFMDDEADPYPLTAAQHQSAWDALAGVWEARASTALARTAQSDGWSEPGVGQLRGEPWYVESADGRLRGVLYFASESQDESVFGPTLRGVLSDRDARRVVVVVATLGWLAGDAALQGLTPSDGVTRLARSEGPGAAPAAVVERLVRSMRVQAGLTPPP